MATKLDREFVKHGQRAAESAGEVIAALANEVERLESVVNEAVRILKEGKAKFAPHTTNSDVDVFLAHHG